METSAALGFGFRCGFLGLLHLEIIQERLTREYDLDLITTAPSVVYNIHLAHADPSGTKLLHLHNPADMPDPSRIAQIEEPWIEATIYVPDEHLGSILKLCQDRRGVQKNLTYVAGRAQLTYELPLNEVVFDFYDRLKSISRGYASFDYHQIGHREGDLVKMNILVNNEPVDALSMIVHRVAAEARGRHMCEAEGFDPEAPLQDPHPGGDRRQGNRPRDDRGVAQGRDGEMLWRGYFPEEEAAG
jgi:GTP-binding protein LepA